MRRTITAMLGLTAATWSMWVAADVSVMAVRLGAKDVVALAKFYDAAFGLKEIDRVGQPPTEIIMRYGTSLAAAKSAGATTKGNVASVKIGKMSVKVAQLVDPDGNVLELMELPKGADHLQHP
ncbi:MAG: hypothetical protein WDO68_18485 [Gammaproteobacteria bacterium]